MRVPVDDPPPAVLQAPTANASAAISTKRVKTTMYTRQEYSSEASPSMCGCASLGQYFLGPPPAGRPPVAVGALWSRLTGRRCGFPILARRFFDPKRPVDAGRFHEEIVGPGTFVVLRHPGARPSGVGDDADGAAADGAAECQLESAGAGRRFVGGFPMDADAAGFAGHVADGPRAAAGPRPDGARDGDDRLRLGRSGRAALKQQEQKQSG